MFGIALFRRSTLASGAHWNLTCTALGIQITRMTIARVDINHRSKASSPDRDHIEEFTRVISRLLPAFHRIALRRLGNIADAEDAVQDALLSAYRHLDQFKGEAKFSTWLTSIVINSAGSKLRRHLRHVHIPLDGEDQTSNYHSSSQSLSDHRPNPEEVCRRLEIVDRVLRLSKSLSPKLRRAFELHYVHGLSTEETAEALGVSNSAAKTQLSRARGRLKRLVLEHTNGKSVQMRESTGERCHTRRCLR
ncbi:RNA polymerase sigma factor [Alloacidobacterium dinghuense]|uniref:RNA polymerase sigma factor n=1 Tax=Alloacidobacterium dinghuense TaxID=2763107 RepID=A0A7G8BPY5_9BACT|nr:RNA polymerase sigma factor [Alloacidobacterium dinghuense]